MSEKVAATLFEIDLAFSRPIRYPLAILKTLLILIRVRPTILFVQNPSLLLSLLAVHYGRLARVPVVVDCHNAGIFPLGGKSRLLNTLALHVIRRSAATLVSNPALAATLSPYQANTLVVPDPLPRLIPPPTAAARRNSVFFICSWASDEPYQEVIEAARRLSSDTTIYITGASRGRERDSLPLPPNVILTGFITNEHFIALLFACDLIVDLTRRQDCLLCGAYEAVAADKPLLVSDTQALRAHFPAALFTDNTPEDIARKIRDGLSQRDRLIGSTKEMRKTLEQQWKATGERLEAALDSLVPTL